MIKTQVADATQEERLMDSLQFLIYARCFHGQIELINDLIQTGETLEGMNEDVRELLHQLEVTPDDEVQMQYDNLFFIPGPCYAPPYVSFYLDLAKEGQNAAVHSLSGCYERFGFLDYAHGTGVRHDHIGTVFMFLHYLLQRSVEAESETIREEAEAMYEVMLEDYLRPMFGDFEKEVSTRMIRGFYRDLVQSAHLLIEDEV
ncbi:TorD/DmsD family molecular chaperone [Salisediminibacterium beveridgei]|uniref:Chaperone TorD involved in molybdoenzyme TorA maturation n=1 Tax=Salisediminibacterium beveridgei TaxID=632773 RepID=A0A1D7QYM3_9BACI|nr:molecular chaperone TorD family protein [Salisediminibacterium beveridgei]AOM84104.1 hypothetical protein BBEV_2767 [Salisediminibacterium beveridgei]